MRDFKYYCITNAMFVGLSDFRHFRKVPLPNRQTEVQRAATEVKTSLPEEAKPLQQRVRFSSSTSIGGDQTGSSPQAGHGDSGVEADLSALNLHEECEATDYPAQELGKDTAVCQKSVDVIGFKGEGIQDNVGQHDFGESPIQSCQKKKGKGMKKEVMMSFGMVKCDRGVRQEQMLKQKHVIKEHMKEGVRGTGH